MSDGKSGPAQAATPLRAPAPRIGRSLARGAALAAGLTCLAVAAPASADEPVRDERHDPDVYPPDGARPNMFVAGALTTGIWYGAAVSFSYLWPDAPGANDLRIPVAGPWMALADTGCADTDPGCSTFTVVLRAILTTIDAVGQAGGLLIMAEAAFLHTDSGAPKRKPKPKSAGVSAAPWVSGDAMGLGVFGSF
ncbi:MAG: hypothetical protein R3B07_37190 [Polyangiaceae bacterium]